MERIMRGLLWRSTPVFVLFSLGCNQTTSDGNQGGTSTNQSTSAVGTLPQDAVPRTNPDQSPPAAPTVPTLTREMAEGLLRDYGNASCNSELVRSVHFDLDAMARVVQWMRINVENHRDFSAGERSGAGLTTTYHYSENGRRLSLKYTHGFGNREYITLEGCFYIPQLRVLDLTRDSGNPKLTQVIYALEYVPTRLTRGLLGNLNSEINRLGLSFSVPPRREQTVTIRYLDSGEWRVDRPNGF